MTSCEIKLEGNGHDEVSVYVKCGQQNIQSDPFNYKMSAQSAPDTQEFGFELFSPVKGVLYAIVVKSNAQLIISNLEITELSGLGAVFLVEGANLSVKNGSISNIKDNTVAGVLHLRNAAVQISDVACTKTSGKLSGVLVAEESDVEIVNSVFQENLGVEKSLLFFIYDRTTLRLIDSQLIGPLPHAEGDGQRRRFLNAPVNFDAVGAESGAAFVSGGSFLSVVTTLIERFPSIKGTIYLEDGSRLECNKSTILNNLALYGGAVYSQDSVVQLEDVHIHKNSASRGGGVLLHGCSSCDLDAVHFEHNLGIQGGGLFIEIDDCKINTHRQDISLRDCIFERNTGISHGGGIYSMHVALSIHKCRFLNNTADIAGGAVFSNSSAYSHFRYSEFVGNSAATGGAITIHVQDRNGNLSLLNSLFKQNKAISGEGGGIFFGGPSSLVNISSSRFEENVAWTSGGALYGLQTFTVMIDDTTFDGNVAQSQFGASLCILDNSVFHMKSTALSNGNAGKHGGEVYIYTSDSVIAESVEVLNCTSGEDGGAFALFQVGVLFITQSSIQGCKANQSGGGVSFKLPQRMASAPVNGARVRLIDTTFRGNTAYEGGGVYVTSVEKLTVHGCLLTGNKAVNGGGLYATDLNSIDLSKTTGVGNVAKEKGGAVYASEMSVFQLLSASIFKSNEAGHLGGACCIGNIPTIVINRATFKSNNASAGAGGAVSMTAVETLEITNKTKFEENEAHGAGGAIRTNQPEKTTIMETDFLYNRAVGGDGGALYFMPSSTSSDVAFYRHQRILTKHEGHKESSQESVGLSLTTVKFHGNEAGTNGGAVYLSSLHESIRMEKTDFDECKAHSGSGGCAYFSSVAGLEVLNGQFDKNSAGLHGGCLFLLNVSIVNLNEANFDACASQNGHGGALYLHGNEKHSSILHAQDGVLTENKAASGGAYYIKQVSKALLDESRFYENEAHNGSGGAMEIVDVKILGMSDMRIDKNTASTSCGGFCLTRIKKTQISGIFTSNKAQKLDGGAALLHEVKDVSIRGKFSDNEASRSGGALQLTSCTEIIIDRVSFVANQAIKANGGAVNIKLVEALTLKNSTVEGNRAVSGAGISLQSQKASTVSIVSFVGNIISENAATGSGGGLVVEQTRVLNSDSTVNRSAAIRVDVNSTLFRNNRAKNGGGVAVLAGEVHFEGCNFTGNDADRRGGGLFFDNKYFLILLNDSLITYNTAGKGGALAVSCPTKVNFTEAFVSRNAADRHDDGGLYTCDEHTVYVANVTFLHNFRDQEWYFYIVFTVGGYAVLFFFLGLSYYLFRNWIKSTRITSIVVHNYSDIGEHDPEASDLEDFFVDHPALSLSEDEPIIAPKPLPMMPMIEPGRREELDRKSLPAYSEGSEIKEGSLDDYPLQQSMYPDHV